MPSSPVVRLRVPLLTFIVSVAALTGSPALAADTSCQQLFKMRSQNSDTPAKITFVSKAATVRAILWLDFNGQPKSYASLQQGESATFDTYLSHPWMIATGPGDCLEIVLPAPGVSVIQIENAEVNAGEEGGAMTSCPAGTVPVPETDNCQPALPMEGQSLGGIMRKGPAMGSAKVASLKEGERIEILEDTGVEMNGYRWFKIRVRGRTGFQWGGIMCSNAEVPGMFQVCEGESGD